MLNKFLIKLTKRNKLKINDDLGTYVDLTSCLISNGEEETVAQAKSISCKISQSQDIAPCLLRKCIKRKKKNWLLKSRNSLVLIFFDLKKYETTVYLELLYTSQKNTVLGNFAAWMLKYSMER